MNSNSKGNIIKLTFKHPKREFYFGSLVAIYEMFSAEQIGCAVEVLWAYNIEQGKPFENTQCVISKETLTRKKHRSK